jgi:hypothetical protein
MWEGAGSCGREPAQVGGSRLKWEGAGSCGREPACVGAGYAGDPAAAGQTAAIPNRR